MATRRKTLPLAPTVAAVPPTEPALVELEPAETPDSDLLLSFTAKFAVGEDSAPTQEGDPHTDKDGGVWRLNLFPYGNVGYAKEAGFVSVFLECVSVQSVADWQSVNAQFDLILKNVNTGKHVQLKATEPHRFNR
jgi:hypothetical protein